jgi:hypothetical protein
LKKKKIIKIDLSEFIHLTQLEELDLSNNEIQSLDLTPLKYCTNLTKIKIKMNSFKIIEISGIYLLPNLLVCEFDDNIIISAISVYRFRKPGNVFDNFSQEIIWKYDRPLPDYHDDMDILESFCNLEAEANVLLDNGDLDGARSVFAEMCQYTDSFEAVQYILGEEAAIDVELRIWDKLRFSNFLSFNEESIKLESNIDNLLESIDSKTPESIIAEHNQISTRWARLQKDMSRSLDYLGRYRVRGKRRFELLKSSISPKQEKLQEIVKRQSQSS